MTRSGLAIPAGFLLLSLAVPSTGRATQDALTETGSATIQLMQAPQQVAAVPTAPKKLTDEQMGDLYMARKDFREASIAYKELLRQSPRNAVYMNKLGIALHQQAELGAALKCYERAVKLDPTYADAQNNIGTIWYQRKKYGRAVRAYEKAIKLRQNMAVLYSNLGYAYFGEKKYEESIGAFRQALALDPQFFERASSRDGSVLQDRSVSDRGRFYYLLAKSFAEAGNTDRAILYLRKAKDEGYAKFSDAQNDPAFTAALKTPAGQDLLQTHLEDSLQHQ
jgi:tetratricopeptide (TPR) repeat protein